MAVQVARNDPTIFLQKYTIFFFFFQVSVVFVCSEIKRSYQFKYFNTYNIYIYGYFNRMCTK